MSQPTPRRKAYAQGPRYYRTPPVWGLIATFVIVLLLIIFLLRLT